VKVYVTGGRGFFGSNLVPVLEAHGAEVVAPPSTDVDLTDAAAVRRSVADAAPDAIVHGAILNDFARLYRDRAAGWASYVGATRSLVDAGNAAGAHTVLVSTDWVFDGTQSRATEAEPPNPINAYGFLKAASELVVLHRAQRGAVARISGVQGVHRARPETPREQDAGFGYFVAALVDRLRAGRRFTVWDSPAINTVATPTLATDAAELIWRILELGRTGVHHCCGGDTVTRTELARRAVDAFGLDAELLDTGPPELDGLPGPVPYDTSLDATATGDALGVPPPGLDEQLERLRAQVTGGG
jgi:dTDP-4-dehydrorhamnose reductase